MLKKRLKKHLLKKKKGRNSKRRKQNLTQERENPIGVAHTKTMGKQRQAENLTSTTAVHLGLRKKINKTDMSKSDLT